MRKPIIAGNWKMYKTIEETSSFLNALISLVKTNKQVEIILFPPATSLQTACKVVEGTPVAIGSQNLFWEEEGAYTGEISPKMIKETGCTHTIIGHSERRQYFSETDDTVNKKIKAAVAHNLSPILCIGESLKEKDEGITFDILKTQVEGALKEITPDEIKNLSIAYEPIWAIGTGRTATPEQANDAHNFIRKTVNSLYNEQIASTMRILYGGSVKPNNIKDLIAKPDIDGALVGGASLLAESFGLLIKGCC